MTGDEALDAIMDVTRADLPLPETRIEIRKILDKAVDQARADSCGCL